MAFWPTISKGGLISESLLQFPKNMPNTIVSSIHLERRWCLADFLGYWSQCKKLSEVKPPLKVSTRISYQYYKKVTVMQKSGVWIPLNHYVDWFFSGPWHWHHQIQRKGPRVRGLSPTTLTIWVRKVVLLEMSTVCRFSTITVEEYLRKCQEGVGKY